MLQSHFYIFGLTVFTMNLIPFYWKGHAHISKGFSLRSIKSLKSILMWIFWNWTIKHHMRMCSFLKFILVDLILLAQYIFFYEFILKWLAVMLQKNLKTQMFKQNWKFSQQWRSPQPLLSQAFVENTCWEVTPRLNKYFLISLDMQ